jgi:hypothetical protein
MKGSLAGLSISRLGCPWFWLVRIFQCPVGFVSKVNFQVAVCLCIFSVSVSQDVCQLKRAMAHAIILSVRRWRLCAGMESYSQKRPPTQRALDAGESARFTGVFSASAFFSSDGVSPSAPAQVTHTVGLLVITKREN